MCYCRVVRTALYTFEDQRGWRGGGGGPWTPLNRPWVWFIFSVHVKILSTIIMFVVLSTGYNASSIQSIIPVCLCFLAVCICELPLWRLVTELSDCRAGQEWRGMTFVAVKAAGHMVPVNQPQVVKQQNVATFKIFLLLPWSAPHH